jgi:tripartite-type tricarboxylate transporter receptor subunit TctC
MKFSKKFVFVLLCAALCAGTLFAAAQQQPPSGGWKPDKPIHIIVPWGAGGSTDQATRVVASELEKALNARIVIQNQPGASGSPGTKNVLDAPRDGYTWASGAIDDLALYKMNGMLDTSVADDWEVFLSAGMVGIVGVNVDSPYQTFDQLLADFKARPGQIAVATAGEVSAGTAYIELIRKHTGIEYKRVTYDGGNPAVTAVVGGEVQVTTQLSVEQANMIRGGRIRPLAAIADTDLVLDGYGVIPSITKFVPECKIGIKYFGIYIPKGVPQEVITTVTNAWNSTIVNNAEVKKWADANGAMLDAVAGPAAQAKARSFYSPIAWVYYESGIAKVSPDTVGIPRP